MLGQTEESLRTKAESLANRLRGIAGLATVEVRPDVAYVGGGSLPDQALKTWVVAVQALAYADEAFGRRLRLGETAVLGRIHDGQLLLDVRTIFLEDVDALVNALAAAAASS